MPIDLEREITGVWADESTRTTLDELTEQVNRWRVETNNTRYVRPEVIDIDESPFCPSNYVRRSITPAACPRCQEPQPSVEVMFATPNYDTPIGNFRKAIKDLGCPEYQKMDEFLISLKPLIDSRKFFEYLVQECEDEYVMGLYQEWKKSGKIPDGYA